MPQQQSPEQIRQIAENVSNFGRMTVSEREAMIFAQARGFREITMLILTGEADLNPGSFLQKVKAISHRAAEAGA